MPSLPGSPFFSVASRWGRPHCFLAGGVCLILLAFSVDASPLDKVAPSPGGAEVAAQRLPIAVPLLVHPAALFDGPEKGSAPAFADLDDDGDFDLVSGAEDGLFSYFENVGTAAEPIFEERFGAANPFDAFQVGRFGTPAFADLDGDGDFDLVSGAESGALFYFENVGTPTSPAFEQRFGADNPLPSPGLAGSAPSFADLDGDGDLDLVSGDFIFGSFSYFENVGTVFSPIFEARTGVANPFFGFDVGPTGCCSKPTLGDDDGDGDLDLVAGRGGYGGQSGQFFYFENAGVATGPVFVQQYGADNPYAAFSVPLDSAPVLVDLNGDGLLDLVSGQQDGGFSTFEAEPTPGHAIMQIRILVDALRAAGMIDGNDAEKLKDKLGKAQREIEKGKPGKAIKELEKFVTEVDKLVEKGELAEADAQPVRDAAQSLIDRLLAEQATRGLADAVAALVDEGKLGGKDAEKLTGKLDKAQREIEKGKPGKAIEQLEKFVTEVNKLVEKGGLAEADAQPLRDAAGALIGQLSTMMEKVGTAAEETAQVLDAELPDQYFLDQNYPNPFNPETSLRFALPEASPVTLEVFDGLGRRISVLLQGAELEAGWHTVPFDARGLASGVYFYRLRAGAYLATRRMTLLR